MERERNWLMPCCKIFFRKINSNSKLDLKLLLMLFFILLNLITFPQTLYQKDIYQLYIKGNIQEWKGIIDEMQNIESHNPDYILKLTEYQYGYIAWCIGNSKKKEAKKYLKLAEENLEKLESLQSERANIHAFKAAFNGYHIGINMFSAPFNGTKSIKNAKQAIQLDSTNFRANLEMGNIWNYMPEIFGGSDKKALVYYAKALQYLEDEKPEYLKDNWMHLNLLAIYGQAQQKMGNLDKAMLYYKRSLAIEPNFIWVKNELLPSLKKN